MKNIGRIFKYNPWINDTHTKYIWEYYYHYESWHNSLRSVIWMIEPIKDRIYQEHKLKK